MKRIIRGVRVATPEGIRPASVHIVDGVIVAVAGYDEIPREFLPEELGKSVLMPGLVSTVQISDTAQAARAGITTLAGRPGSGTACWVDWVDTLAAESAIDTSLLARVWTELRGRESIESVMSALCSDPAKALAIDSRKGSIAEGLDADFVLWNPEQALVVQPGEPKVSEQAGVGRAKRTQNSANQPGKPVSEQAGAGRAKLTQNSTNHPAEHEGVLYGQVRETILRGTTVCKNGALIGSPAGAAI